MNGGSRRNTGSFEVDFPCGSALCSDGGSNSIESDWPAGDDGDGPDRKSRVIRFWRGNNGDIRRRIRIVFLRRRNGGGNGVGCSVNRDVRIVGIRRYGVDDRAVCGGVWIDKEIADAIGER